MRRFFPFLPPRPSSGLGAVLFLTLVSCTQLSALLFHQRAWFHSDPAQILPGLVPTSHLHLTPSLHGHSCRLEKERQQQ